MKVLSVQAGQPRTILHNGRKVRTSIYKKPINTPVAIGLMGIESDTQSDLTVHGGRHKAVYAYATEHFAYWKELTPQHTVGFGTFGENLSTLGLHESEACIGDVLRIGSVVMRITQPRFPCFKLGIKFGDNEMIKLFHQSLRSGIYFEVLEPGSLKAGDSIEYVKRNGRISIQKFLESYVSAVPEVDLVKRIINDPNQLEDWRVYFKKRIDV